MRVPLDILYLTASRAFFEQPLDEKMKLHVSASSSSVGYAAVGDNNLPYTRGEAKPFDLVESLIVTPIDVPDDPYYRTPDARPLRDLARVGAQLLACTLPVTEDGKLKRKGNPEECLKWYRALKDVAAEIAQYESPRLSAIAIAPPQRATRQSVTVRIFDSKGTQLDEIVDGQQVPFEIEDKGQ